MKRLLTVLAMLCVNASAWQGSFIHAVSIERWTAIDDVVEEHIYDTLPVTWIEPMLYPIEGGDWIGAEPD